jgi:hypothetical protein
MIKILNKRVPRYGKEIRRFCRFLDRYYPVDVEVTVEVLKDLDLNDYLEENDELPTEEGHSHMGFFYPDTTRVVIAVGAIDCTVSLLTLAHEYCHFLQANSKRKFGEMEADCWASRIVLNYEMGVH